MLLTRSIRWKLIFVLGLVVMLVLASTTCSLVGLSAYRRTVEDLELSTGKLPRQSDLAACLSLLFPPLAADFPRDSAPYDVRQRAGEAQRDRMQEVFHHIAGEVEGIKQSWLQLPDRLRSSRQELVGFETLFRTVDNGLRTIQDVIPGLGRPEDREVSVQVIGSTLAQMLDVVRRLPDPAGRLGERLREAKSDYLLQTRLAVGLGVISVLVLIGLMSWGHQMIFAPIRELHKGVKRISMGDYGFRLKIKTQCEIAELAQAFNEMGRRIQEDRANKEREIEERSKQLVMSERLVGAGFLASGVAHEINNPLSVIMTAAYGLEMRLDDEALAHLGETDRGDIREYLGLIQSEAERCERITKKLLDFSYGKAEERNRYDVTAIVQEVANMVGHLSRYQDRRVTVDRTTPLHAWVNAAEIKQVVLNLTANALDATTAGGYVDLSLREYPEEIEIVVEDDGCGMTPEQQKKIFEPFFTTKDVGKGTGLGLSITHRIVRDHGGTLEVESAGAGQGSRFTLRLPRTAAKAQSSAA
ncbi:sensor histidine kinase [Planctomicrobium sp. SH661]|uniref:sensor histidine kinase n=1 Tax=Planctomicrobium sp. SH661 TaxID=3448124 RepID=UPI003F5B9875